MRRLLSNRVNGNFPAKECWGNGKENMKKLTIIIVFFVIATGLQVWADTSLRKASEWPFSPPTLFLKGGVNAIASGNTLIFWAVGDTIEIIDKSTFTPRAVFRVSTSTAIQDMLFDDETETLYVAAGYDVKDRSGGLQIFDISEPGVPVLKAVYDKSEDNPGSSRESDTENVEVPDIDARGLGLFNGILFLADDNFGLRVIDVSTNPSQPVEVGLTLPSEDRISGYKQPDINGDFTATGGYVNLSLYPYGDKIYAFVLDFYNGVKVFDVTDPKVIEDPVMKDTRTSIWFGAVSLLSDIFVNETGGRLTAFVTGSNSTGTSYLMARLDTSFDEEYPIQNFGRCFTPGEARSVCASGNYAYVADGVSGLTVVDISKIPDEDSQNVIEYTSVGSYVSNVDLSYCVLIEDPILYLASGESGLNKLNVSNPAIPVLVNRLDSVLSGDHVCVSGNYTYMLDSNSGLRIFDSTQPSYLSMKSYIAYNGPASDLAVSGNYAYIADSHGYISILDVSDPSEPFIIGVKIDSPDPRKLFIKDQTLYIADASGLRIVDIAKPLAPVLLSTTATAGIPVSVYVHENRAYMAEGNKGVDIFDVSNTSNPVLLSTITTADNACDVSVVQQDSTIFALIADGSSGLKIINVSNVEAPFPAPVEVRSMDTDTDSPGVFTALTVTVLGNNAYVGIGDDGVLALDLESPGSPKEIDHATSASYSSDIVANKINNTIYLTVAEKYAGFRTLYLYDSTSDGDAAELVPTIDTGCFIGTAVTESTVTDGNNDIIQFLNRIMSI